jgi:hypothetical protein
LRGSILFADLPGHGAQARPASAPAVKLEPIGEAPHPESSETALPRVTFRTGHNGSVAQRMP